MDDVFPSQGSIVLPLWSLSPLTLGLKWIYGSVFGQLLLFFTYFSVLDSASTMRTSVCGAGLKFKL